MSETGHDPLELVKGFEDFLGSVYEVEHILSSEEYRERREFTLCAYPVVLRIAAPFLGATKNIDVANSIGIPDYGKAICFPYRFLGQPSVSALPRQAGDNLSNTLDDVFFSGLNFQFFWATFPTRNQCKNVDEDALKSRWLLEALLADRTMRRFYQGEGDQMAKNLFDIRYSTICEPLLKQEIKVGFFKRGVCKAFLRNIYWAGALLGAQYDMATN